MRQGVSLFCAPRGAAFCWQVSEHTVKGAFASLEPSVAVAVSAIVSPNGLAIFSAERRANAEYHHLHHDDLSPSVGRKDLPIFDDEP